MGDNSKNQNENMTHKESVRLSPLSIFSLVFGPWFQVTLSDNFNRSAFVGRRHKRETMTKTSILEQYPPRMENVLLILHDLQNHNPRNYLSKKDLGLVAAYLNTTLGVMYGIATYYTMFSLRPRGKHIIRICRSPVCHLASVTDVLAELKRILKIDIGETTTDKHFTLETTECLGQCDVSPAMMVDDMSYGNLTRNKIRSVIQRYRQPRRSAGKSKRLPWNEK